jgi:nucleotide-binding universal stress UspA family protein
MRVRGNEASREYHRLPIAGGRTRRKTDASSHETERTETMEQPFRVLLATDGSEEALNAEAWVSRLRWDRPCEIGVLCVAAYGISGIGWLREGDLSSGKAIIEQLRKAEVIAAERTANEAGLRLQQAGFLTRTLLRQGDVAEEIIATTEAESPDLVAIGPRGRSRIAQSLLGSVPRQVISKTRRPVLIAREPHREEGPLPQSILVLVDGTHAGTSATEWLLSTGWARDADVTLLGLLGIAAGVDHDDPELAQQVTAMLREEAAASLESLAEQLVEQGCDVSLESEGGHPVDAALHSSERIDPDLIIVPRQRRGHDPLGEKIVRYSKTTVVIAPEP